ncbi:MAG TPA: hypothetical protein VN841_02005 [Bryobacteraceae bacterium]|nr:hypothetical protein [Bryobacteraceae bacterium]
MFTPSGESLANPPVQARNAQGGVFEASVVDRVGFDDRVRRNQSGHPHSDKLHIVERHHRTVLGHIETEVTVEDPGVLARLPP